MKLNQLATYPLPLNGLRYFYWASKLGSFKLAAETLNVSEAAISQQIRNLEEQLKIKLFERGHQKVTLSALGQTLFPYIQSAFVSIQEGIQKVAADPRPNRITISTMPSFASNWLITRLVKLNQQYPELSISIDTTIDIIDFEDDSIDIAIRYGLGNYSGLKSELLMHDPIVLVCSPNLVNKNQICRQDVIDLPAILGTADGVIPTVKAFKEFYEIPDTKHSDALLLADGGLGAEAARNGQGISMQRLSLVADMIESGELVYGTEFAMRCHSFYAVAPEHHFDNPKVIKFLDWLRSEMKVTSQKIQPLIDRIKH